MAHHLASGALSGLLQHSASSSRPVCSKSHIVEPLVAAAACCPQRTRCWMTSPASVACASTSSASALLATMAVSPHPDAVLRRQEQERLQKQREQEREAARTNTKWWQGAYPTNMRLISCRSEYDALIEESRTSGQLLVMNFFTEDCYTCRSLLPKLKQIAGNNPDVLFAELNGSEAGMRPLFGELEITRVPTMQLVRDHQVRAQFTASLNPEKVARIRAEIAAHKGAATFVQPDTLAYAVMEA